MTLVRERFVSADREGEAPILMTSQNIRPSVCGIVERFRAKTPVLSQGEIHPRAPQNRQQHPDTCALGRSPGEGRVTETAPERP